jgi:hypothetical protein
LIADILTKNSNVVYFHDAYKSYEIDFLSFIDNKLFAIEVKRSNHRAKSLKSFINDNKNIKELQGIKFIDGNIGECDEFVTYPKYMAMFLKNEKELMCEIENITN